MRCVLILVQPLTNTNLLFAKLKLKFGQNQRTRLTRSEYKLVCSCVVVAMWMSSQRSKMDGLLETEWRDHYSNEKESANKFVFEMPDKKSKKKEPGIDVNEDYENMEDYMGEEVRPSSSCSKLQHTRNVIVKRKKTSNGKNTPANNRNATTIELEYIFIYPVQWQQLSHVNYSAACSKYVVSHVTHTTPSLHLLFIWSSIDICFYVLYM